MVEALWVRERTSLQRWQNCYEFVGIVRSNDFFLPLTFVAKALGYLVLAFGDKAGLGLRET